MSDSESLKKTEGLLSYVECTDSGDLLDALGKENLELSTITASLVQLGEMVGKHLGNERLLDVYVRDVRLNARFKRDADRLIGLEYVDA